LNRFADRGGGDSQSPGHGGHGLTQFVYRPGGKKGQI
jgi:hypothetical protein